MAKLHFYYSAMNAGKTTTLLQSSYNYRERGMETLLFTPEIDDRTEVGKITSRIGLEQKAITFDKSLNFFSYVKDRIAENPSIKCCLVDEAQFLNKEQVHQLTEVVDKLGIPVLAYGLRTDFRGEPFEGSLYLLAWAEDLSEIKTICHCGRKATMTARVNDKGEMITGGDQIEIGGNEKYVSTCRLHHKSSDVGSYQAPEERKIA